ncbi:MAG: heme ABC exporter ATP-binding protein CcmA [SAR202 cluster bacterium]|nr:heme ABC exporter ATP-binding protein CcmA [SAR202 cluster bacterium]
MTVPGSGQAVVSAAGLQKSFGRVHVLNDLDLEIQPGESVGMLGPNGAGKTTLLRVLATLSKLDSGSVAVNGHDLIRAPEEARRTTGVVMHAPMLYQDLTARENLEFHAGMYRIADGARRIRDAAGVLGVADRLDDRVRNLSHGLQKRVALARALLHRPRLLLLDEPDAGLDQSSLAVLVSVLAAQRADGGSTLLVTHNLERSIEMCDRILMLAGGRVVADARTVDVDLPGLRASYTRLTGGA